MISYKPGGWVGGCWGGGRGGSCRPLNHLPAQEPRDHQVDAVPDEEALLGQHGAPL